MSIGPLRRSIGALGLTALVPVAVMVATGSVAPVDAATRAVVTVIVLLLLGRAAGWGLHLLAVSVETAADRRPTPTPDAAPPAE